MFLSNKRSMQVCFIIRRISKKVSC